MTECETELIFLSNGAVSGVTDRVNESIGVLGLDAYDLRVARQRVIRGHIAREDREYLLALRERLSTPQAGRLEEYAPILVNLLNRLLPP